MVVSGDDASEEEVAGIVNNQVDSIHQESVSIYPTPSLFLSLSSLRLFSNLR